MILSMGEIAEIKIEICTGCMAKHADMQRPADFDRFIAAVQTELETQRPDRLWNIATQSCFRLCPEKKITITVAQKMTMTREATVASVVQEILSFLKPLKSP